jgi:hypothetical protein
MSAFITMLVAFGLSAVGLMGLGAFRAFWTVALVAMLFMAMGTALGVFIAAVCSGALRKLSEVAS